LLRLRGVSTAFMFLSALQFETERLFGTPPFPKRALIRYHPARP
jgi:hypothetical protein